MNFLNLNSLGFVKGPASTPWSPTASGLDFHVSAEQQVYTDAGITLATNGQSIQQWNDLTGNSLHFFQDSGNIDTYPIYKTNAQNGLPSIDFDGVAHYLRNGYALNAATTIIIVMKANVAAGGRPVFAGYGSTAIYDGQADLFLSQFGYKTNQAAANVALGGVITNPQILTLNYASLSSLTSSVNGTATGTFDPANTYTASDNGIYIGSDNFGVSPSNCEIYEILAWNRSLTAAEQLYNERGLGAKWGITTA